MEARVEDYLALYGTLEREPLDVRWAMAVSYTHLVLIGRGLDHNSLEALQRANEVEQFIIQF